MDGSFLATWNRHEISDGQSYKMRANVLDGLALLAQTLQRRPYRILSEDLGIVGRDVEHDLV
jgi:hypothetical protein